MKKSLDKSQHESVARFLCETRANLLFLYLRLGPVLPAWDHPVLQHMAAALKSIDSLRISLCAVTSASGEKVSDYLSSATPSLKSELDKARVVDINIPGEVFSDEMLRSVILPELKIAISRTARKRLHDKEAQDFLRNYLASAPKFANAVRDAAEKAGITECYLKRAKKFLGIISVRVGLQGPFQWSLPQHSRWVIHDTRAEIEKIHREHITHA